MENIIYESTVYDGIIITKEESVSLDEVEAYVSYLKEKFPKRYIESITMTIDREDPEMINLEYRLKDAPFERIRRITGYLVGTMDKWNDGKTAEERDRVKHSLDSEMEVL